MKWLDKYLDKLIDRRIKEYMAKDEGMAVLYSIIGVRGKFTYFLANKTIEEPQKIEYWINQEKEQVIKLLAEQWQSTSIEEITELVENFYNK